ncbi:MAG: pterin-4-alpha-carbinolamine dehydratase [Rhodospirillaceae bacterium]|jgi:4a-hydroxytetrahydrobiopterin dehydratase|nr:pterin-4-alpha-carbinolamine dehydratase [Rhodospirillaceae bacterium]|tara:strand:- start:23 stop:358 length:336 start_codon:yes stop_codon:yes gene_type:complete
MDTNLEDKFCEPCRGGVAPLGISEAQRFLSELSGWDLRDEGKKIYKEYKFSNFVETLEFVNKVGALAEDEGHHPDIAFGWGYANVTIFSHKIEGLHENDFILASKIDLILS